MRGWMCAVGALCLCVLIVGCSEEGSEGSPPEGDQYSSRGIVTQMPGDGPNEQFRIRHEPMPDFRDAAGEPDPMPAMTMPFPPGEGVSLDGLAVGDKVSFEFSVVWATEHAGWTLTSIEKLPEDTQLDFDGDAGQPEGDHDSGAHEHMDGHTPQTVPQTSG